MIVVCARESPRSAIISTRSRKLSLSRRYQRTQRTIISRSKCRPLKSSSMLSTRQLYRSNNQPANYAALTQFAPEPRTATTRVVVQTLEVEPIRGLEVALDHAASTAFQISGAVLYLTRSLSSLN